MAGSTAKNAEVAGTWPKQPPNRQKEPEARTAGLRHKTGPVPIKDPNQASTHPSPEQETQSRTNQGFSAIVRPKDIRLTPLVEVKGRGRWPANMVRNLPACSGLVWPRLGQLTMRVSLALKTLTFLLSTAGLSINSGL